MAEYMNIPSVVLLYREKLRLGPHLSVRVGWINELFKLWGLVPHFIYACPNSNPLKTKKVIHVLNRKCQFCVFANKNEAKNHDTWMVQQWCSPQSVIFCETKCLKNILNHLATLSVPKVVKNGQKVPILAKYEILFAAVELCTLIWSPVSNEIIWSVHFQLAMRKKPKKHQKMTKMLPDFWKTQRI